MPKIGHQHQEIALALNRDGIAGVDAQWVYRQHRDALAPVSSLSRVRRVEHWRLLRVLRGRGGPDADVVAIELAAQGFSTRRLPEAVGRLAALDDPMIGSAGLDPKRPPGRGRGSGMTEVERAAAAIHEPSAEDAPARELRDHLAKLGDTGATVAGLEDLFASVVDRAGHAGSEDASPVAAAIAEAALGLHFEKDELHQAVIDSRFLSPDEQGRPLAAVMRERVEHAAPEVLAGAVAMAAQFPYRVPLATRRDRARVAAVVAPWLCPLITAGLLTSQRWTKALPAAPTGKSRAERRGHKIEEENAFGRSRRPPNVRLRMR